MDSLMILQYYKHYSSYKVQNHKSIHIYIYNFFSYVHKCFFFCFNCCLDLVMVLGWPRSLCSKSDHNWGIQPMNVFNMQTGIYLGIDKRRYKIRLDFVYIAVWNFNVYGPCVWVVHLRWFACKQTFYSLRCVDPVLMIDKST